MGTIVQDKFIRPSSGLVNGLAGQNLGLDEFTFLQNVHFSHGNIVSRGGTVAQGSAPAAATVRWLFHAYGTDASAALVVRLCLCGTSLYYKIGSGAWTSLKGSLTAGTYPVAVQYKGHVYWCDGVNTPQDITIANPPTITDWVTLPSGINPSWVVLHLNKLKYGGDLTTPNYYYQTDFGTPGTTTTTSFYLQPDDQNSNYPKIAVLIGRRVGLFCQDYLVSHSGAGPNTDQFFPLPRGAACSAWRSVVDMGEFGAFFLTKSGIFAWDGNSPPEPIDPLGKINWSDIDYTTETDTWAVRVGDEYRLYFKSKGDVNPAVTTVASATVFAASIAELILSAGRMVRNYLTRKAFGTSTQTNTYYSYDCRLRIWTGPHTGNHLCGAWEQYLYGDKQQLWVGSATTGGKIYKADQPTFTDDGEPYDCIIRTGSIGNPYHRTQIKRIVAKFGICMDPRSKCRIAVWQNGAMVEPPTCAHDVSLYFRSAPGGSASTMNKPVEHQDFVMDEHTPDYKTRPFTSEPQIEYRFATDAVSNEGFQFRGHEVTFSEV